MVRTREALQRNPGSPFPLPWERALIWSPQEGQFPQTGHVNLHSACPTPHNPLVPKGSWALRGLPPRSLLSPSLPFSLHQLVPWPWFALEATAMLLSLVPDQHQDLAFLWAEGS